MVLMSLFSSWLFVDNPEDENEVLLPKFNPKFQNSHEDDEYISSQPSYETSVYLFMNKVRHTPNKRLQTSGIGYCGSLGLGDTSNRNTFTEVLQESFNNEKLEHIRFISIASFIHNSTDGMGVHKYNEKHCHKQ